MANKNWNDRADRELFFTILSVKNIGIVSGAEWSTIGNHMRTMGYGFTNEGCRQHFQGLRRTASKVETSSPATDTPGKVDPTLNPITRRPGPGRGKSRKSKGAAEASSTKSDSIDSGADGLAPETSLAPASTPAEDQDSTQQSRGGGKQAEEAQEARSPLQQAAAMEEEAALAVEAGAGDDAGEHPSKRQRVDSDVVMGQEPAMDDEAVLALAAHNGSTPADYADYGDA